MKKRKINAVLFDLDGTLVDSHNAWFHVFNDTHHHFNKKRMSLKVFKKHFGASIDYDIRTVFKGRSREEIIAFYNKIFHKRLHFVSVSAGVRNLLNTMRDKKIKLAVTTGNTRKISLMILRRFKLKKYFPVIVTMNDVKHGKPHPETIHKACRKLRVSPQNAILVGDSRYDMKAGKRAGCLTIGYKRKGDFKINKMSSVLNYINQKI
jgi:pyrophosphatase PpaX